MDRQLAWRARIYSVAVLSVVIVASSGNAQESGADDVVPQIWLDYNPIRTLSAQSELFGDVGARTSLESNGAWRLVVRPGYRYRASDMTFVTLGVGSFYATSRDASDEWEVRPFQGVAATWPNRRLRLQHYLRLEQRLNFDTSDWSAAFSLRSRYRLRAFRRFGTLNTTGYWMVFGSGEAFANLTGDQGQFREVVRFTLGIERAMSRGTRIRASVTWQLRNTDDAFLGEVNDIYLRLRVYHGRER